LDACLGRKIGKPLKGFDELRATVGIAGIIDSIDADEDIAGTEHFSPAKSKRKEYGIARRYVGNRDPVAGRLRHIDARISKRRTTYAIQIQADHLVLDHTQLPGDPLSSLQ